MEYDLDKPVRTHSDLARRSPTMLIGKRLCNIGTTKNIIYRTKSNGKIYLFDGDKKIGLFEDMAAAEAVANELFKQHAGINGSQKNASRNFYYRA